MLDFQKCFSKPTVYPTPNNAVFSTPFEELLLIEILSLIELDKLQF